MTSFSKKALESIEAAILNRASKSMLSMSIGGKAISMMSLSEQLDIRQQLLREVNQETLQDTQQSPFKTLGIRLDV